MRPDRDRPRVFARARIRLAVRAFLTLVILASSSHSAAERVETKRIALDEWGVVIEYRAQDEKIAAEVSRIFRQAIPRASRELGLRATGPFRVFLLPDVEAYQRRVGFRLPRWGVAFAFAEQQIMIVDVPRAAGAWNTLEKVIPHELSHLLLAQRAPGVGFPLWFMEGLAQWQAREWSILESWRLMEAVWGNRAPPLDQIAGAMPTDETSARDAYRVAYAGFQHRFDGHPERISDFLDEVVRRGDFAEAFRHYWRESEGDYAARFAEYLGSKYRTKLLLFQTGPLFTLASVLFIVVVFKTWVANRRRLKRMSGDEGERPASWGD
jgi:hypothetical protein